jgi:hypothetical protein
MLSNTSRALTYSLALLYAVLGLTLFVLPEQMAPVFAWKVTGFMTMTIGAWCMGNAVLAFLSARRWAWEVVYSSLVYLWAFGITESLVVLLFRGKLQLGHPIASLYLATLVVNVLAAAVGAADWMRLRPQRSGTDAITGLRRWFPIGFVLFVGGLGLYGLLAQIGDLGTNGEIFPEIMSLFTLRSFGAFYLSLAISVVPLIFERNAAAPLHHALAALGLVVFITIAALVYLRVFNLGEHPYQLVYFAAYLVSGSLQVLLLLRYGIGARRA